MPLTRREIALAASRAASDMARRRRISKALDEMDLVVLDSATEERLAERLRLCGWVVVQPGSYPDL